MSGKNFRISVLSYFFITFVLDGLQRLSGLFALELLQSTNMSRQNASIPFIFSWVFSNIVASFSGMCIDDKKSDYAILFGVILSATGAALCILATDITTFTVFWGLIFGSGHGLTSPHLFNRLMNTDSTKLFFILQVTPGLGVAIMPFLFSVLNSYYGLQGSCLIFCGIILNYLPLSLAAAYNVEICIPNIKWRVRKKSKQYSVSKKEENKTISHESFINSLEPDLILKICQKDEFQGERIRKKSELSANVVVIPIGRKRSETRGYDLPGLEMDKMFLHRNKTHSQVVVEIKNYEKGRKLFESSFTDKGVRDGMEQIKHKTSDCINWDINNSIKILEKNILNTETESYLNLKNKLLDKISESEINQTDGENKKSSKILENNAGNNTALAPTYVEPTSATLQNLERNINGNIHQTYERSEKKVSSTEQKENLYNNSSKTFQTTKSLANSCEVSTNAALQNLEANKEGDVLQTNERSEEISSTKQKKNLYDNSSKPFQATKPPDKVHLQISPSPENKSKSVLPMSIKVHVEEYTFEADEDDWEEKFNNMYLKVRKNSHRTNSNSVVLNIHKNSILSSQNFSKSFSRSSDFHKTKLSSTYTISEKSELFDATVSDGRNYKETNKNTTAKRIFKFLNGISSQVCLCILLINITFEINLVTLLTMFADFGNDVEDINSDFKWILVAFGVGGLAGKICCCKISRAIPDKYHSIGVVLFLLTGLSTAGILYSSNMNWLASFYCIFGALEGGITYIIPKFILEYVDKETHSILIPMKRFLSGAAIICIPYAIGLFRDEMGDYEFLLQILSCSSVLCAFLAYFLPYFRTASSKRKKLSFRNKTEIP